MARRPGAEGPEAEEGVGKDLRADSGGFKAGDIVAVKLSTIRNRELSGMTPRVLIDVGWPNKFQVMGSFEHQGEPHVSLFPCCFWMLKKVQGEKYRCKCHPARLFEKIPNERGRKPGDAHASIHTPFGPLAEVDYEEGDAPVLTMRVMGYPLQINSSAARRIKDIFRENGIM